jgi:hypothetical protein
MDWINKLFLMYHDALCMKKMKESTCKAILEVGPNLKIWVQKTV